MYLGFKNHRWVKYYEIGFNNHGQQEKIRLHWGRWVCREFNTRYHGVQRVKSFQVWIVFETLDLDKMDGTRNPAGKSQLWNHVCY
jgi:hypothetical protein